MKSTALRFVTYLPLALCWLSSAQAEIIFEDDFDSYQDEITGWSTGSNIYLQKSGCVDNSACAKVAYTGAGTGPYWFGKDVSAENLSEIYVKFDFKVDNPSGGSKFLKLFGKKDSEGGYANTTFAINYNSGMLYEVSYGSGVGTVNDTQAIIRYNGTISDKDVSVIHKTGEFDPADNKWHSFEAHMKYNDNGKRNGIYRVWIDGELRLHATNIKNRHDNNSMFFNRVDLANYSNSNQEHDWNLWYDNVVIATHPIGGGAFIAPMFPSDLNAESKQ